MSENRKVVVTDYTFPALASEEAVAKEFDAAFTAAQCRTEAEVIDAIKDADAVFAQFAPITQSALEVLKPGALVVRYGVGYDNIDVQAAKSLGVSVAYVPDYCSDEVADHTAALMLALLRKLPMLDASIRNGEWAAVNVSAPLKPFGETIVGFVGLGRIGRSVMARLKPFGFRFVVADPGLTEAEPGVFQLTSVNDVLANSDIITLHAPSTPSTRGLINAESLAKMKDTAFIVNSARGDLIQTADLVQALNGGKIAGAGLDVFEEEPLPTAAELRSAPNTLLTPHAAWYSETSIARLQSLAADEVARHLRGETLRCPVI